MYCTVLTYDCTKYPYLAVKTSNPTRAQIPVGISIFRCSSGWETNGIRSITICEGFANPTNSPPSLSRHRITVLVPYATYLTVP
jgi:hypothetical protein